ncbi:RNA-binding protein [Pleomorphomonas sp. JP5]|uniref:RNA-binding protein n=1 Tax=Pleomorphomonas sp. JP5 TaxID=2942998 RepID=UPI002042CBD2|nr:RNA-binding protein [Pleomorphomonas sp. JP5]MCM5557951.1 RNA-binding protein [Pleomorphomonas sp. JP5]
MAPRSETAERSCIVTRVAQPPEGLVRFVCGPGGVVVPDIRGNLPGRGVWVTCRRDVVAEAVRKRAFSRGLKEQAKAGDDLPELVEALLLKAALSALSMARKAGLVITGFGQVSEAVSKGGVVAVLHAREAADDGRRKIRQAIRRRLRAAESGGDEDETPGNAALWQQPQPSGPKVIAGFFASSEMDLAFGGANVIHAALLAGGASTSFLKCAAALARYRGEAPDTDWTASLS